MLYFGAWKETGAPFLNFGWDVKKKKARICLLKFTAPLSRLLWKARWEFKSSFLFFLPPHFCQREECVSNKKGGEATYLTCEHSPCTKKGLISSYNWGGKFEDGRGQIPTHKEGNEGERNYELGLASSLQGAKKPPEKKTLQMFLKDGIRQTVTFFFAHTLESVRVAFAHTHTTFAPSSSAHVLLQHSKKKFLYFFSFPPSCTYAGGGGEVA